MTAPTISIWIDQVTMGAELVVYEVISEADWYLYKRIHSLYNVNTVEYSSSSEGCDA